MYHPIALTGILLTPTPSPLTSHPSTLTHMNPETLNSCNLNLSLYTLHSSHLNSCDQKRKP
jgi:hypothetical protein